MSHILARSEHFAVSYDQEIAYLEPTDGRRVVIGDFYGNPKSAVIDWEEKWVVVVGCGLILYWLREPFRACASPTHLAQCREFHRLAPDAWWIEAVYQTSETTVRIVVEATGDHAGVYQFNVEDGSIHRIIPKEEEAETNRQFFDPDSTTPLRPGNNPKFRLDPEIKRLFKVRFNEVMADGSFSLTQFAVDQLASKGLSLGDGEKVVENALGQVLQDVGSRPHTMPRPEDVADVEAFLKYFHGLITAEVERMIPHDPVGHIRASARILIYQLRPMSSVGFGLNRESPAWLEGYIERLRQAGGLAGQAQRNKLASMFGSFVGECIIACYGGTWVQREGSWCVAFDKSHAVFPFLKVAKQIENGVKDGIGGFSRGIPVQCARLKQEMPEARNPVVPLSALQYAPTFKSANPKQEFQIGKYTAILFDEVLAIGPVRYRYALGVFDEGQRPLFLVTSEVNAAARQFGGGSHFLCIFDGSRHLNRGGSDDWADEQKFTTEALRIVKKKFPDAPEPAAPSSLVEALQGQLTAYFGAQEDEEAIRQLRQDVKICSGTFRILHDGIIQFLFDRDLDCLHLVQSCANRNVHGSRKGARVWMLDLFARLFVNSVRVANQGRQLQPSPDPEFRVICHQHLQQLSNIERMEMKTFAEELLATKDLPVHSSEKLVQHAMRLVMEGFEEDGERRPGREDIANQATTATFLRAVIVKEVILMALNKIPPPMQ